MNIPIAIPLFDRDEEESLCAVIRSGWVSQGKKVREFEDQFAAYVGAGYAVATTSCTTALHAALMVSGIGAGDDVIVPSLSFIATANSVVHAGARPVFADVDPDTCNITIKTIEKALTKKTKAIMPVHQMGLSVDLDPIQDLCRKNNYILIEDAACAVGSEYKGRKIGGSGNMACFSFHPRKIITTGEGGMITTNDSTVADKLRKLRHHGMSVSDVERHDSKQVIIETYQEIGYNYRMTDLQAAMGIAQLKKLKFIIERRRQIANIYDNELSAIKYIKVPRVPAYAYHNYQSYWIELSASAPVTRDKLMQQLLVRGIATRRGIMAIHMEDCYKKHVQDVLPDTERITKNAILLPIYPSMTHDMQSYVIKSIKEIIS